MREYVDYFHHARPHQVIDRLRYRLTACDRGRSQADQRVNAVPIRGGLHHDYRWAA